MKAWPLKDASANFTHQINPHRDRASVSFQPPRRILAILSRSEEANNVAIRIFQECFSPEPGLILRIGLESQPSFLQPRHSRVQVLALEIDNNPRAAGRLTGLVDREGCVTLWTLKAGIAWEVLHDKH